MLHGAGLLDVPIPNGVQGVAGSNPAVPTVAKKGPASVYDAGPFSFASLNGLNGLLAPERARIHLPRS